MSSKVRLDVALVERGMIETRAKAQATIMSGQVFVNGQLSDKPGTPVAADAQIEVRGHTLRYVSRCKTARGRSTPWTWATVSWTGSCGVMGAWCAWSARTPAI